MRLLDQQERDLQVSVRNTTQKTKGNEYLSEGIWRHGANMVR